MYRLIPDDATIDQVAALPAEALLAYAEVLTLMELTPWAGGPQHESNPDGAMRRLAFGRDMAGHVVYLILEARSEVHILLVQWLG